jgi:hypothetical protein
MHCTDIRNHRARLRRLCTVLVLSACCVFVALPAAARADGDPASDVLTTQPLFLPADAGVSFAHENQLNRVLATTAASGFPIRVAVIASASDLGSVTPLWRQPQTYAGFLGEELSLVYHGTLLVVMPAGFGLYGPRQAVAAGRSALAGLHPAAGGAVLGTAALSAVERVAAAAGHPVTVPTATATATAPPSPGGSTGALPIVVFVLGLALIAAAWGASLRARPLRLRGRGAVGSGSSG